MYDKILKDVVRRAVKQGTPRHMTGRILRELLVARLPDTRVHISWATAAGQALRVTLSRDAVSWSGDVDLRRFRN